MEMPAGSEGALGGGGGGGADYNMGMPQEPISVGRDIMAELMAEKDSLDSSYIHCARLLDEGELWRVICSCSKALDSKLIDRHKRSWILNS